MKRAKDMTITELFATVDPPYVRWKDVQGVVHAAGQKIKGSQTFCDQLLEDLLFSSDVTDPVTCMFCIASAEERGILP